MVRIRLKRMGSKNRPAYRIVVADARAPRDGRVIEEVGWYNPMMEGENFHLKMDRVEYWLKCGAQPTETVASFIKRARKKARQHAAPSA